MARGSRNASLLGMLGLLLEDGRQAEVMQKLAYESLSLFIY